MDVLLARSIGIRIRIKRWFKKIRGKPFLHFRVTNVPFQFPCVATVLRVLEMISVLRSGMLKIRNLINSLWIQMVFWLSSGLFLIKTSPSVSLSAAGKISLFPKEHLPNDLLIWKIEIPYLLSPIICECVISNLKRKYYCHCTIPFTVPFLMRASDWLEYGSRVPPASSTATL